jgi:phage shock protein A
MATTTTTTEAKLVKLWARVEAATVNSVTGEVVHTPGVDPKYLAVELVREIQGLSQQLAAEKAKVADLTAQVADLTAKLEAATKATAKATTGKKRLTIPADDVDTATGTDI